MVLRPAAGASAARPRRAQRRRPAGDRRAIRPDRGAGGQPHAVASPANAAVTGHDPQRHGGFDRGGAAIRPPHLGWPPAHGSRPAAVRGWAAAIRRVERGRARPDRPRAGGSRPLVAGHADRSLLDAVRPVRRGRVGAGAEDRRRDPPYRIRPARARPGVGGAGGRGRAGGEPRHRNAAGPAALLAHARGELPERTPVRPVPCGVAHHRRHGDAGQPQPTGRALRPGGGGRGWRRGRPRPAAASAAV